MAVTENQQSLIAAQIAELQKQINKAGQNTFIEPPPECRLLPTKQLKEKAGQTFDDAADAYQNIMLKGMDVILSDLIEQGKAREAETINQWFIDHSDKVLELLKKDSLHDDMPIEESIGFPRELLNNMHLAALHLFQEKKLDEAMSAILTCILFNATLFPLWFTYGMILQEKGDHAAAIYTFTIATIYSQDNNPYPSAYIAKSWTSLQNYEKAKASLVEAMQFAAMDLSKYMEINSYCENLKSWIDHIVNK